jgi:hypothetical protein
MLANIGIVSSFNNTLKSRDQERGKGGTSTTELFGDVTVWSQHHQQQNRGANTTNSKIVEPTPPTAKSWSQHHQQQNRGANTTNSKIVEPTPPIAKSWSQHHQQQNRGANTTNSKIVEPTPSTPNRGANTTNRKISKVLYQTCVSGLRSPH